MSGVRCPGGGGSGVVPRAVTVNSSNSGDTKVEYQVKVDRKLRPGSTTTDVHTFSAYVSLVCCLLH